MRSLDVLSQPSWALDERLAVELVMTSPEGYQADELQGMSINYFGDPESTISDKI